MYHITIGSVKRLLHHGKEWEKIAKTEELHLRTDEIVNLKEAYEKLFLRNGRDYA